MDDKYLITTKNYFCTKDGTFKNVCLGKLSHDQDSVTVGNEGKDISFNVDNILTILRCDEKPIELDELGFEQVLQHLLNIYIAE